MALRLPAFGLPRKPLIDPRDGDIETDASSPEHRSMLALAGNLLAEVSLPKLVLAAALLIVVPTLVLGLTPLAATLWLYTLSAAPRWGRISAAALIILLVAVAWFGARPLLRVTERSFWALNAIAIQPAYVACREALLQLASRTTDEATRERRRIVMSALAGLLLCGASLAIIAWAWPFTRWTSTLADLRAPFRFAGPAVANAVVIAAAYLAVAGLAWGIADATMPQPRTLTTFGSRRDFVRTWRVAHLSDLHVVGERYGFRLGSGRAGPRGNGALLDALDRLDAIHRRKPLDAIVITGDLTDAGTPAEWAELLDALERFPRLRPIVAAVPGNHDLNVVDRANPARIDLPTSPKKRLRQMRTVSMLDAMQGDRMRVVDERQIGDTLDDVLVPHAGAIRAFADRGSRPLAKAMNAVWHETFPMVLPPPTADGLGIIGLNSNSETHFSFTNALGVVDAHQARAINAVMREYPRAVWIIALHHHIVEHDSLGHKLGNRIGTTLINGTWFTRRLQHQAGRAIVMHGHRHIDWIGACGELLIVSAPSAVMPARDHADVYFYIHTIGVDPAGHIGLGEPERIWTHPGRA